MFVAPRCTLSKFKVDNGLKPEVNDKNKIDNGLIDGSSIYSRPEFSYLKVRPIAEDPVFDLTELIDFSINSYVIEITIWS